MAAVMGGNIFGQAKRILFKTIPFGDWKKFGGVSNSNPKAGGGARDLRYNGFNNFDLVAQTLFSAQPIQRNRGGVPTMVTAYQGKLKHGFGLAPSDAALFENPTDVRDAEWRFTKVNAQSPIAVAQPIAAQGDVDILVLVQEQPDELVPVFTTLNTMPPGQIRTFIAQVCSSPRKSSNPAATAAGFLDLVNGWNDHN
ncbi:hypothetical protein [Xanthomonas arboricola]|uniref:hypothetical protein n=1 Tax=Xanthomonas arboricola TaxID=56448 RepID=UPI0011B02740|nr:hypothetical protein [Xanthomonas arboricola]